MYIPYLFPIVENKLQNNQGNFKKDWVSETIAILWDITVNFVIVKM